MAITWLVAHGTVARLRSYFIFLLKDEQHINLQGGYKELMIFCEELGFQFEYHPDLQATSISSSVDLDDNWHTASVDIVFRLWKFYIFNLKKEKEIKDLKL